MTRLVSHAILSTSCLLSAPAMSTHAMVQADRPPNVILILTDDQGYGDISAHGNPILKTPKLDALYRESIRFTDFHVAPMCTPTRGELMTGIDAFRNGATAVCEGRSMPRRELKMMPQYFQENGYSTGHFGKWHLGDNYPYRPQDRGFDNSVRNAAWGIGSLAEHWENDAFDDVYWHNNELKRYPGYNTDVFFKEAMAWMEKQQDPFFVYLPTTAAHAPFVVPEQYSSPYQNLRPPIPNFYGMIANIDKNVAVLDEFLEERGLKENTILIFMTDNGTVLGDSIFNAGMRGKKTSEYDGGHRVPFFLRWPAGGYDTPREIDELTHSTDLLPTLIELCELKKSDHFDELDGCSFRPLLEGLQSDFADRKIVIQYRATFERWRGAVLWKKWRLVNGRELYNVEDDPGQRENLFDTQPKVVDILRDHYLRWVAESRPIMQRTNVVNIGTQHEPMTWLSSCNWTGSYADNWNNLARQNTPGHWDVHIQTGGEYRVTMYMFHPAANVPLNGSLRRVQSRPVAQARLIINGEATTRDTEPESTHATFDVTWKTGQRLKLEGQFLDVNGNILSGAFYTFVQRRSHGDATAIVDYVSPVPPGGELR